MSIKDKSVLLINASHLSSCPRLIKEAIALEKLGFKVKVLYLSSIPFVEAIDNKIIEEHSNWEFHKIDWKDNSIKDITLRNLSRIVYLFSMTLNIKSNYISSTAFLMLYKAKRIKADLYIAHQPISLVAAAESAKKFNAKYAYDIEDAFPYVDEGRYEENPDNFIMEIENKYLDNAIYTSSASPAYIDLYLKNYPGIKRPIQLLNVFDTTLNTKIEKYYDRKDTSKVSLYWFSQTVGLNRGLQDVLLALQLINSNLFELHIRGNCTEQVKNELLSLIQNDEIKRNVFFHQIVDSIELERRNMEHDIGLVLEVSNCLNKELCITNKMFDYIRSGLCIIATETIGNESIMSDFKPYNFSYKSGNISELVEIINKLVNDKQLLEKAKEKSRSLAIEKYNWDIESNEWVRKIKEILG